MTSTNRSDPSMSRDAGVNPPHPTAPATPILDVGLVVLHPDFFRAFPA